MLKPLYNRILKLSARKDAVWWMSAVSFAESSFFPLPPDVMLVPMCLAEPKKLWRYTNICALASLIGGLFGYAVGFYLFESIGRLIIDLYNAQESFQRFQDMFAEFGPWFLILKGITPIPYKLLTITAGFAHLDLTVFILCSIVARFSRFYMIAILLHFYGPQVRDIIEKRLMLVTTVLLVIIIGGLLSFKFV
ncbi:DedA family protein [Azospirillum brasilense]|jgi:membrane protein YqaA with SNARE-associated domain|uniref:DedA family protein n=6 Tax=Azospirillum TaxID=191 RepID=A0A4D8QGP9_AZOBR|nr:MULTISPECIES: YqaA family protein [Azospirillum]AIB12074.1 cytochrome B561 [Azospirillum argentinense]ALJ34977.1 cytochrome B [Azospirillum brasilense]AWJ90148.1 DedA family protein [Azospirillum baldaniorum]EZQ08938.1 cytochrome B561 [Azospirillum argentinense]KAA1054508.1 lipoprotein B [Azospirillum argentinense]